MVNLYAIDRPFLAWHIFYTIFLSRARRPLKLHNHCFSYFILVSRDQIIIKRQWLRLSLIRLSYVILHNVTLWTALFTKWRAPIDYHYNFPVRIATLTCGMFSIGYKLFINNIMKYGRRDNIKLPCWSTPTPLHIHRLSLMQPMWYGIFVW